jgi:broad specificity phosphatase PhoE
LPIRSLYITHPEVQIDPAIPVAHWGLSLRGRERGRAFAARGVLPRGSRIVASTEAKAVEMAAILAEACEGQVECREDLGENDRSSTGFLPQPLFEARVEALFARPDESDDGWETAQAAQARVVRAVGEVMAGHPTAQPVVFVGHGCVGALLKCWVAGRPIARNEDQHLSNPGGGNAFAFDWTRQRLLADWAPIEALASDIMAS